MSLLKQIVVAIYVDPDFYPPTINAILNFATNADEVIVISRNNTTINFDYPSNVKLIKIGSPVSVREMEKQSVKSKLWNFIQFATQVRKYSMQQATDLLVLYDPLALFAYHIFGRGIAKKKVWYHNHDMPGKNGVGKFSLVGRAAMKEHDAVKKVNILSLPDAHRKKYYTDIKAAQDILILPNFPSPKVYGKAYAPKVPVDTIKLIYQGFIGEGHGLETILQILDKRIAGYKVELICKGSVSDSYKLKLKTLAEQYQVADQLRFITIGPYKELMPVTAGCHIGIAINTNNDAVSKAQGTASNKIYEYAAIGLPVIINNAAQFLEQLKSKPWVFFVDDTVESIQSAIENIMKDWLEHSRAAKKEFEDELNFENFFTPVFKKVLKSITE